MAFHHQATTSDGFPSDTNTSGDLPHWIAEEQSRLGVTGRPRSPGVNRSNDGSNSNNKSVYASICRSPDFRRTYYRSSRQTHRMTSNNTGGQQQNHQEMLGSMTYRVPDSEPIYMDIDPSIHNTSIHQKHNNNGSRSSQREPPMEARTAQETAAAAAMVTRSVPRSPVSTTTSKAFSLRSLSCAAPRSTSTTTTTTRTNKTVLRPPSRTGAPPMIASNQKDVPRRRAPQTSYPYVNPHVSPTAQEYHVPGGMFGEGSYAMATPIHHQSLSRNYYHHNHQHTPATTKSNDASHSPTTPNDGLIMFGDDYDLGSCTTGASQQELLKKRRDVKKRRDAKQQSNGSSGSTNKKKSKKKERILNMPPRLLSMGSWDTTPITAANKLTAPARDTPHKQHHRVMNDNDHNSNNNKNKSPMRTNNNSSPKPPKSPSSSGKHSPSQKIKDKWNILRAFSNSEDEMGSTDASTRESGEEAAIRKASPNAVEHVKVEEEKVEEDIEWAVPHNNNFNNSDNQSLSSFPLLSTNAKEGFDGAAQTMLDDDDDDEVDDDDRRLAESPDAADHKNDSHETDPYSMEYKRQEDDEPYPATQQKQPSRSSSCEEQQSRNVMVGRGSPQKNHPSGGDHQKSSPSSYIQQQEQPNRLSPAALARLEKKESDSRPRSVRFADKISQDFYRDASEEIPFDEDTNISSLKESPTSVADFDEDPDSSKNSVIAPKTLFTSNKANNTSYDTSLSDGKPKSILRKRSTAPLDGRGRYRASASDPGVGTRGRLLEPVFTDSRGREVSPIRSHGRRVRMQEHFETDAATSEQPRRGIDAHHADDLLSVPSNPDKKDVEVLFDSETDADLELLRREFEAEDSGLISDEFIEAVAAIVLQTAIRRFLAIRKAQLIRDQKKATTPPRREERAKCASTPESFSSRRQSSHHSVPTQVDDIASRSFEKVKSPSFSERLNVFQGDRPQSVNTPPRDDKLYSSSRRESQLPQNERPHNFRTASPETDFEEEMKSRAKKLKELVAKAGTDASSGNREQTPHQRWPSKDEFHEEMEERMHQLDDLAATQIQSLFRGWWVRDSINVDYFCATLIQSAFRGYACRMRYHMDTYHITLVQSLWRQKMVFRRVRFFLFLVVRIQAAARGYLARRMIGRLGSFPSDSREPVSKQTRKGSQHNSVVGNRSRYVVAAARSEQQRHARYRDHQVKERHSQQRQQHNLSPPEEPDLEAIFHVAATIIQCAWRGYVTRLGYLQAYADILICQNVARRWLSDKAHTSGSSLRGFEQNLYDSGYRKESHVNRGGRRQMIAQQEAHFEKFGSFESSKFSSSFQTESYDLSSSVGFRVLTDDDPVEQPPSLSPPRKGRDEGARDSHHENPKQSHGYCGSAPESHGMHATPNGSDADYGVVERVDDTTRLLNHLAYLKNSHGEYESPAAKVGQSHAGRKANRKEHGQFADAKSKEGINDYRGHYGKEKLGQHDKYEAQRMKADENSERLKKAGSDHMTEDRPASRRPEAGKAFQNHEGVGHYTAGWNAEEEIEKGSTRNLLQKWKQADRKNSLKLGRF